MLDKKYILSFDGECDRLERQSQIFGHERGYVHVAPKPGTRLLDAGCGSGWLSRLIASRHPDCEVVGIDINPDYVAYATAKAEAAGLSNLRYQVGQLGDLPFEADAFDTVWSLMVMMFLRDRPAALADMARVLRPGGRLVTISQGTPLHRNAPRNPALETPLAVFLAHAFPDWRPEDMPLFLTNLGLTDITVQLESDPMYSFLGAATPAQVQNHMEAFTPGAERMADALGGAEAARDFLDRLAAFIADPRTTTVTGLWTVSGVKPL